ncbi:MAG: leucine-rich repeat protein [Lachnospiraceae bacterium]
MKKIRNSFKIKEKTWYPVLFLILSLFVLFSSDFAFAADSDSGSVTDTINYTFDGETGQLVISGTGALPDCIGGNSVITGRIPWFDYRSEIKSIVIENGITYIGGAIFYDCGAVSVVMADSVAEMGEYAFDYCDNLTSVTLSKNIKIIPENCFYSCGSLASVTIPSGVKEIHTYAFAFCKSLTGVTIPGTVTEIEVDAFYDTPYFDDNTDTFMVVGDRILLKYNGTDSVVNIPSGTKTIASKVFMGNTTITKVVLPTSVTYIGSEAFSGCTSLTSLNISSNIKYIGFDALLDTPYISQHTEDFVILGDGILYDYQGNETEVTIPEGVKVIGPISFSQNFTLTKVNIPDSVTIIGQQAFMGCINLDFVSVPSGVTTIEDRALGYYWSNITEGNSAKRSSEYFFITGEASEAAEQYASDNGFMYLTDSVLSGVCGESASYSFDLTTGILTITGEGAMEDYSGGTTPWSSFRSLIREIVIGEGITYVGVYNFYYLTNLETVQFPSSLERIGNYAFYNSYKLEEIILPESFNSWNSYAFVNCNSLKSIRVDSANTSFASLEGVLYNANKTTLICYPEGKRDKSFTIEDTVTRIESRSFRNSKFETLYIPKSVTDISNYAFYYCENLKLIEFEGNAPSCSAYFVYSDKSKLYNICYHSSKSGWDNFKATLSSHTNIVWLDTDSFDTNPVTLNQNSVSLAAGESCQLFVNQNFTEGYFVWLSSDASVAGVSDSGCVYAGKPGTAIITAESIDGNYRLECNVSVTGTFATETYKFTELPEEEINYTYSSDLFMVIPCENLNGIYFLNKGSLVFHSLISDNWYSVYDFGNCTDAYYADDRLYLLKNFDDMLQVIVYNTEKQAIDRIIEFDIYSASAIGVDGEGRIYLVSDGNDINHPIYVFSGDGTMLAKGDNYNTIYRFAGFDSTNGNFYAECYYNWRYWGYDHATNAAKSGRYADGTLTMYNNVIRSGTANSIQDALMGTDSLILFQQYYSDHQNSLQLIGDKYLIASSILYGKVYCMDSDRYTPGELTEGYSYMIARSGTDGSDSYSETSSVGVNAVYNQVHDSILMYRNNCLIEELDPLTGKKLASYTTKYPVFNMTMQGQTLVLVEKNGDTYYLELVQWLEPSEITISGNKTMKAAETTQLTAHTDSLLADVITWKSSDPSIASVTSTGKVVGWKSGTVTITASSEIYGISSDYTITVTENAALGTASVSSVIPEGTVSSNISANNQTSYWSQVPYSYIYENTDGTFTRVEYISGTGIVVETYTSSYTLKSKKTITMECSLFGGFYHSEDGSNYVVEGQENLSESDSVEVVRIIKYSSSWVRLGSCSVYGANTYIPFDAGSCRMTELDGKLYIYTCHEMYASSDGYHHQANMTFVMDTAAIKITDSYYDVMNSSYGYVSHSFNQFIQTDGEYIYRVDHGDAYPRGIYLSVLPAENKVTNVCAYGTLFEFQGYCGYNSTGASLGGFELSEENCLIVGNSVDHSDAENYDLYGQRNIFLIIEEKTMESGRTIWLTDYAEDSGINPYTPQLVKLSDEHFLIMWEEYNENTGETYTRLVNVDGSGNITSPVIKSNLRLSDCQPIVTSDGLVAWYVTDGSKITLYTIEPYNLEKYISGAVLKSAGNGTAGVNLSWDAVDGATGYKIYRKTGSGSYSLLATLTSGTRTSYTDATVVSGVCYTYAIVTCASDSNGNTINTGKSNGISILYLSASSVAVSNTATGVKVSWSKVTGAEGYYIYRRAGVGGKWVKVKTVSGGNVVSCIDTTSNSGTTYYYAVRAYSGSTTGFSVTSRAIKYLSSQKPVVKNATSGVNISWSQVTGAEGYYVYRKTGVDGTWSRIRIVNGGSVLNCTDTTAVSGTTYYYAVRAYSGSTTGFSITSNPIKCLKSQKPTVQNAATGVKVSWSKVTGAEGYYVYRKAGVNGAWTKIKEVTGINTLSYTDTTANSGTIYYYAVRAYSGSSTSFSITGDPIKYLKSQKPTVKNAATGVKVSWSKVTGAGGYYIYRKTGADGTWSRIKTVTGGSNVSYIDTTAANGVTYYYAVKAYSGSYVGSSITSSAIKRVIS